MPTSQPNQDDVQLHISLALALGELKGQVQALTSSMERKSHTDEDLMTAVAKLQTIPDDLASLKQSVNALESRLNHMETRSAHQAGATSFMTTVIQSPVIGWLVGAAVFLWTIFTEKSG